MTGGMTDEQTASFVDTIASMDASTLKLILRALVFLGSLYQPAVQLYTTVDSYTLGCARYLVLFLVMIVLYYVSMVVWALLRVLFAGLYALYTVVQARLGGNRSGAVLGDVAETVYSAATTTTAVGSAAAGSGGAAGSLASKVLSEGVLAGAATAAAGMGAAAAVGAASKAAPAAAVEADDSKYDF